MKKRIFFFLIEVLIVNFIVYFIYVKLSGSELTYFKLNPNPLIFLTLGAGLLYGTTYGFASGLITTAIYMYIYYKYKGEVEDFLYYFQYYKYPLMFLWTGVVGGIIRDNFDNKLKRTDDEKEHALEKSYKALKENEDLRDLEVSLKKQIEDNKNSILYLTDISLKMENTNSEEVFTELALLLMKYLEVESFRIYSFNSANKVFRLKVIKGDHSKYRKSFFLEDDEELSKKLSVDTSFKGQDSDAILKMFLKIKSKPVAIIYLDKLSFDNLTLYTLKLFETLVNFAGRALERNQKFEDNFNSREPSLLSKEDFDARIALEDRRANLFNMEYSIIHYSFTKENKEAAIICIKSLIRETDYLLVEESSLTLMFTLTDNVSLRIIKDRIANSCKDLLELEVR